MDYIKAYQKISEAHTNLIDCINFMENKFEIISGEDLERERNAEELRNATDKLRDEYVKGLKELNLLEIHKNRGGRL